jgi:ribosome-binding factor A
MKHPKREPKNPNRLPKLNSLLQQLVGEAILPYVKTQNGLTTVSQVEVSGDSRWAKVWVSIVAGDDDEIFKLLNDNIYDIQGEINNKLGMKMTPRLQFFLDTSPRYAQHINELIHKVHEEDAENES